eukprot:SAG31_NODE_815_length_11876_cov_2.189182_8_plen_211_part_00
MSSILLDAFDHFIKVLLDHCNWSGFRFSYDADAIAGQAQVYQRNRNVWCATGNLIAEPLTQLLEFGSELVLTHLPSTGVLYVSLISVLLATGIVVGAHGSAEHGSTSDGSNTGFSSHVDLWMPPGNYVNAMGTISFFVFAYSCTQAMPPIISEMGRPSVARVDGIILAALVFCTVIYVAAALGGYIAVQQPAPTRSTMRRLQHTCSITFY